jgi:hypothetical protein
MVPLGQISTQFRKRSLLVNIQISYCPSQIGKLCLPIGVCRGSILGVNVGHSMISPWRVKSVTLLVSLVLQAVGTLGFIEPDGKVNSPYNNVTLTPQMGWNTWYVIA